MVSEKKKTLVQSLVQSIKEYPIVGIVNLQSLPAQQLQNMRALLLKGEVKVVMARKKLLALALKESNLPGIAELADKMKGMPALILSKGNPFTLYATIQKNKSEAPAKAGQEAPKDVIVKAGATNFAPGPIISELAAVGIKTKVDNGKLAIIDDVTVAKEGDIISVPLAETLKRLDIKPMEVGLNLIAVWEDGVIFAAKQLHVDEAEYAQNITQAAQWAMNLAVDAAIPNADTVEVLLQKAFRDAKGVAVEQSILNDVTRDDILAKAEAQANSVKDTAGIEVGAAPAPKAEEKAQTSEEKKEEAAAPVEQAAEEKTEEAEKKPAEEEEEEESEACEPTLEQLNSSAENFDVEKLLAQDRKQDQMQAAQKVVSDALNATQTQKANTASIDPRAGEELARQQQPVANEEIVNKAEDLLQKLQKNGTLRD